MQANDLSEERLAHDKNGQEAAAAHSRQIRVEYRALEAPASGRTASPAVLGAIRFGAAPPAAHSAPAAPFTIDVQLDSLRGPACELWYANGTVRTGQAGLVRYAHDDHFLLAVVDEDERTHGGIRTAGEVVYSAIRRFRQHSPFTHVLRMWNYLDAINEGDDDLERYRQFCIGRARGLGEAASGHYPAASAIGRQRATHRLQVLWLAGRQAGTAIENPRQISAYRYPRTHGPVSPTFSRATVTRDGTVLISGTASIVGHVSQHPGDATAQLEETLRNLATLTTHIGAQQDAAAAKSLLKVYVRDRSLVEPVAARLREVYPNSETIFLAGDICRRELLLEIECVRKV